jgi:tetratricopeptide (TPR) repeat protein
MKSSGRNIAAFALLFFIIIFIYSNTFQSSWHLDDYPSIIKNPQLHLTVLSAGSVVKAFFGSRDGGLYLGKNLFRPIACLSLALNWYFGKDDVFSYHIVNIAIHIVTAFILFLTILNLLKTPQLQTKYEGSKYFIGLCTATLWAINPIQTQAVTYIVQRMAALAAMFYLLSIFLYLKGRFNKSLTPKVLLYTGCFVSFLLAIGSKENAATLPIALILTEIIFFQDLNQIRTRRVLIWGGLASLFVTICLGLFLFYQGSFSSFLAGYNTRSFSLIQRLLTEPRIVIFYITQIFYPIPTRLSIEHDILLSNSLFDPWTTLPSIVLILVLIGFGLSQSRKRPIVALAILFFFLNHMIESTIIPLELLFEHRNYLPSFFIFLPVAVGIKRSLDIYRHKNRSMYMILVSALTLLIMGFGMGTYIRNMAWATEKTLWEDAITKAPGRARPYQNLAFGYYKKIGDFDKAFDLYKKALKLKSAQPVYSKISSLTNMAKISYRQGDYEKAFELSTKALDAYPHYIPALHVMTLSLLSLEQWKTALQSAESLLSKNYLNKDYNILYGYCLLKMKNYAKALYHFRNILRKYPNDKKILYNIGVALNMMKNYDRAELFLRVANQISTSNILTLFYLIENQLKAGDQKGAERYLEELFAAHSIQDIKRVARGISKDNLMITFSPELLAPVISSKIEEKTKEIEALGNALRDDVQLNKPSATN